MLRPVYTEPDKCRRCYKCIRECPVKAIQAVEEIGVRQALQIDVSADDSSSESDGRT